jgi:hypothetical protein
LSGFPTVVLAIPISLDLGIASLMPPGCPIFAEEMLEDELGILGASSDLECELF